VEKTPHQNKPLHIQNNPQGKPALEITVLYNYPVYNLSDIFSHRKMRIWKQSRKKMPENPGKALAIACLGMAMKGEKCVCNLDCPEQVWLHLHAAKLKRFPE
jgi:hypothetical protein